MHIVLRSIEDFSAFQSVCWTLSRFFLLSRGQDSQTQCFGSACKKMKRTPYFTGLQHLIGPELTLMLRTRHLQKVCLINSWLPMMTH